MPSRVLALLRENVSALLEERKANQTDLAKAMRVQPSAVSQFLSGRRGIELYRTDLIAHFFNVPVERLFQPLPTESDKSLTVGVPNTAEHGIVPPSAVTAPVMVPADTGAYPRKETMEVPSREHRALYVMLASLDLAELKPLAPVISEAFLRHFGGSTNDSKEADSR